APPSLPLPEPCLAHLGIIDSVSPRLRYDFIQAYFETNECAQRFLGSCLHLPGLRPPSWSQWMEEPTISISTVPFRMRFLRLKGEKKSSGTFSDQFHRCKGPWPTRRLRLLDLLTLSARKRRCGI
ncbi:unnamed protein product, partial [Cladocopium goreaui]